MWETRVWALGWEVPLQKGMATLSSILAWKVPWTEEPSRLRSMGSQRVKHDWATNSYTFPSWSIAMDAQAPAGRLPLAMVTWCPIAPLASGQTDRLHPSCMPADPTAVYEMGLMADTRASRLEWEMGEIMLWELLETEALCRHTLLSWWCLEYMPIQVQTGILAEEIKSDLTVWPGRIKTEMP